MTLSSTRALLETPADSIDRVLERMVLIDAALPAEDGVAYFNRMYMRVTEEVKERLGERSFENQEFLDRLDIVFANLYFQALANYERDGSCSPAWKPLFDERQRPGTAPIQFALAGMNAHICHDLPLALVHTCDELALGLDDETPEHRDYTQVNSVLGEVQERIKEWFAVGVIARIDDAGGRFDDALALWSLATARSIAWQQGQTLYGLRGMAGVRQTFETMMARSVGLGSRGILL